MINLAEAVKLKSILQKKFYELRSERRRVAFVTVEKGEEAKREGRTVAEVEKELEAVQKDIRTLDRLVYEANSVNTIEFMGEQFSLVEAIEYAKQLRLEESELRDLSYSERETYEYGYGDQVTLIRVALFDPEEFRVRADELERKAHKLSNLINAKNYEVKIDFDDSKYY